jgi:hypothetical protein
VLLLIHGSYEELSLLIKASQFADMIPEFVKVLLGIVQLPVTKSDQESCKALLPTTDQ